ncbi:MAG TPA: M64 family metallopeptidase [bacterium]|nr:M64 family metallopeptidase [bacterium]HPR89331.1 M64 family metallopeptidase [bacterium]
MRKLILFLLTLKIAAAVAQTAPDFDTFFDAGALRLELFQTGDASEEIISAGAILREPLWPASQNSLIDPFNNGRYTIKLFDIASNTLIYSSGMDCMFGEYRTTNPAIEGVKRTFRRAVRIPLPKHPANFVLEKRDKNNLSAPFFMLRIDPADYHINTESAPAGEIYASHLSGDPALKADLLFIAEGYTAADQAKFHGDVDKMRDFLFSVAPYSGLREQINIRGLFIASPERGMDEPRQGSWKNTLLNASFNSFDLDRYMLIEDGHLLRRIASQAPYDAIIVLVNSSRYGGGGIYNDYCCTTVDHALSKRVFIHEFGHAFAGLADEYYTSDVAYNEFYPKGIEPLEPNITALLDPAHIKWQSMLSPGITLPTEYGKSMRDSLQIALMENGRAMDKAVQAAKKGGAGEKELEKLKKSFLDKGKKLGEQLAAEKQKFAALEDKVGAFEGAGYASRGLYRPMMDCLMISNARDHFCRVCEAAITRMVEFYAR